jgi:N-hydroxyarylamine O-acetyltransferase
VPLDLEAYLARIGYGGPLEPTAACLDRLHLAHVVAIPFENLDVLLGRPIHLDVEHLQDKLVRARRGGYCFEHNTLFAAVLETIGFRVTRLAARVRLGRNDVGARTHMVLGVRTGSGDRLADVGFGGGSILEPLEMEPDRIAERFGWRFRVIEEDAGRVVQRLRPEGWLDLYAFTDEPQLPIDFEVANHYTSTHPGSAFMRTLTAQRSMPERSLILRGSTLTEITPTTETSTAIAPEEVLDVLAERFGLVLPAGTRLPVEAV